MKFMQIIFIAFISCLFAANVYASDGRGLEIATEADVRDNGFGDTTSTMTMTLFDQYGNSTSRKIRNRILEGTDEVICHWLFLTLQLTLRAQLFSPTQKNQGQMISGYTYRP